MLRLWSDRGPYGQLASVLLWALGGGSIVYYIFFWNEPKKGLNHLKKGKRKQKGSSVVPLGLENPGNLCYVNAVLQALASCKKGFIPWIEERSEKNDFCLALNGLLKAINREEAEEFAQLKELLSALRSKGWVLDPREQDAHELFNVFLTTLEEEGEATIKQSRKRRNSLNEALSFTDDEDPLSGIIARNATISSGSSSSLNSPVESLHPFSGTLTNKLIKASSNLVVPVSSNYFNNVTLSLPSQKLGGRISLQTLLESFTSREELDSGVVKQTCFAKLPACICFHIQRTAFDGGYASKRSDRVYFPQILDMSHFSYGSVRAKEYLSRGNRHNSMPPESTYRSPLDKPKGLSGIYLLKAVIQHAGAINSGHYVTYRVNSSGKWFFTSDLYVEEVDFSSVLEANPYMLFYEKEPA